MVFSKSTQDLVRICKVLRRGEVVAAPTETAYGLLADATSRAAVKKLFTLKRRQEQKVSALVVADFMMARRLAEFSPMARKLARAFWPGPLTLILPSLGKWPPGIVNSQNMIGLRIPGSAWLRQVIRAGDRPLTATSANISGCKNLYDWREVQRELVSRNLKYLVIGRRRPPCPTSTIIAVSGGKWKILRPGAISLARIKGVVEEM